LKLIQTKNLLGGKGSIAFTFHIEICFHFPKREQMN